MGVEPVDFGHREHVRLAYVYLCREQPERAYESMKRALLAFLERIGAGTSKYNETITHAWIMAINHFMESSEHCRDFNAFVQKNPQVLDPAIMLEHYSARTLFSDGAREQVLEPDIAPIPRKSPE
jgi:hypothetical protein